MRADAVVNLPQFARTIRQIDVISSAKNFMKNAKDAIGIHPSVAERLSATDG